MFKRLLLILALGFFTFTTASAQDTLQFSVPVTVHDSAESKTLNVGIHPEATGGIDDGLDELAPPRPPSGAFYARLYLNYPGEDELYTDIRDTSITEKTYRLTYQPSENNGPIHLEWDPEQLSQHGNFTLVDTASGGTEYSVNMNDTGSVTVTSDSPIRQYAKIKMTPYGDNEAPVVANAIGGQELTANGSETKVDLSTVFNDPEGDPLSFTVSAADSNIVQVDIANDTLNIEPWAEGQTELTVFADDGKGNTTPYTFEVVVNPALQAGADIDPHFVTVGLTSEVIDLRPYFTGGTAPYSFGASTPSDSAEVMMVSGHEFRVRAIGTGEATVNLTITDVGGALVTRTMRVHLTQTTRSFNLPLHATDGANWDTLEIGMRPNATDGFDDAYDVMAPPAPPSGAFDARILNSGNAYFSDVRDSSSTIKHYTMEYGIEDGQSSFVLSWDSTKIPYVGKAYIVDPETQGDQYRLDMSTISSLDLTTISALDGSLTIEVVPEGANKSPMLQKSLDKLQLTRGQSATRRLGNFFMDPEGAALSYSYTNSADSIVSVTLQDDSLSFDARKIGYSMVSVRAVDPYGRSLERTFKASVVPADGNGDGIPDSTQSNVSTITAGPDGRVLSMTTDEDYSIDSLENVENPSQDDAPAETDFPLNFLKFQISGVPTGGSAKVTIQIAEEDSINSYYLYSPTESNTEPHWFEFLYNGETGARIQDTTIVVHFVDGKRGDADLTANGVIEDPGAPARVGNQPPPAPTLQAPSDSSTIVVDGAPSDSLAINWTDVEDPDGDQVYYTWKAADHRNLDDSSDVSVTVTQRYDHWVKYETLDSLMAAHNIALGDTLTLHHRVNATDNRSVSKGEIKTVMFVRGEVRNETRVQFINTLSTPDTVDVYVGELAGQPDRVVGNLPHHDGTPYLSVGAGDSLDLHVTASGSDPADGPNTRLSLDKDSVYQVHIGGHDSVHVSAVSRPQLPEVSSNNIKANVVHAVMNQFDTTAFELYDDADENLIHEYSGGMEFGEFAGYARFAPTMVRFRATNHHKQFIFDMSDEGGRLFTFVMTDQGDTTVTAHAVAGDGEVIEPSGTVDIDDEPQPGETPETYSLKKNYPNPFNPETQIGFSLPEASDVRIDVYNVLGRHIKTLVDKKLSAGQHRVTFDGQGLTSGIYIYKLQTPQFQKSRKMLLVK